MAGRKFVERDGTVDIFGGLRTKRTFSRRRNKDGSYKLGDKEKFFIQFQVPDLRVKFDKPDTLNKLALQVRKQINMNVNRGKDLNGNPLPPAHPKTIERRAYRREQANRKGGPKPSPRLTAEDVKEVKKNYRKRFGKIKYPGSKPGQKGPKLEFNPNTSHVRNKYGVESGMMLKGLNVVAGPNGTFQIFFPNKRAILDMGQESAVLRCFGSKGKLKMFDMRGLQQPAIRQTMQQALREAVGQREINKARQIKAMRSRAARDFVNALKDTARTLAGIPGDLDNL